MENNFNIPLQLKLQFETLSFNLSQPESLSFPKIKVLKKVFKNETTLQFPTYTLQKIENIISNIYEGGFKIWECTLDLLEYLSQNPQEYNFEGKKVLDLGCGQGPLGIYALQKNASFVCFQDFNAEVLDYCTINNIKENFVNEEQILEKVQCVAGDWGNFEQNLFNSTYCRIADKKIFEGFDIILASEILYNQENYEKIAELITRMLNPQGICLIGSKVYYFGVGGSIYDFNEFLQKRFENLKLEKRKDIKAGSSINCRQILSIQKNK